MSVPDVTVTVIVHNDAARLPRAVASVRRQTHANIEIVISDDHSTDGTPAVARALAGQDHRILYLRLPHNSGGCSAPRNRALDIARAPYVMFLDSDDELPDDAVELLLAAHRQQPQLDFAMGAVRRIRVDTGRTTTWMPQLVAERRTVDGIEAEPRLFFEHLATSKMYARDFLDRHGLRFPEGIHYEDQLFSAQAYCLAKSFTIIPEPVYRWYIAPYAAGDAASISNQRHRLANVHDRVHVQTLVDAFLLESGHAGIREEKDYKFLKHDFRMYAGDLPFRDGAWLTGFAELVNPYLESLTPGAFERLPRAERVVIQLVRELRLTEAVTAARELAGGVAPRTTTLSEGRLHWGDEVPSTDWARRELDLSDEELDTRPFPSARFRHEITELSPGPGLSLCLTIRTYDPGFRLPVGPQRASLVLTPGRHPLLTPFRMDPVAPGVFEGQARLTPSAARLPFQGFHGVRHPLLRLEQGGMRNTGPLLAPLPFPSLTARTGTHRLTAEPEPRTPGRLQLRWEPLGMTAKLIRPVVGRLAGRRVREAARLVRGVLG